MLAIISLLLIISVGQQVKEEIGWAVLANSLTNMAVVKKWLELAWQEAGQPPLSLYNSLSLCLSRCTTLGILTAWGHKAAELLTQRLKVSRASILANKAPVVTQHAHHQILLVTASHSPAQMEGERTGFHLLRMKWQGSTKKSM